MQLSSLLRPEKVKSCMVNGNIALLCLAISKTKQSTLATLLSLPPSFGAFKSVVMAMTDFEVCIGLAMLMAFCAGFVLATVLNIKRDSHDKDNHSN